MKPFRLNRLILPAVTVCLIISSTGYSLTTYKKVEETTTTTKQPAEQYVIEHKPTLTERKEVTVQNDPAAIVEKKQYILEQEPVVKKEYVIKEQPETIIEKKEVVIEKERGPLGTTVNFIGEALAFPFELVGGIFKAVF